MHTYTWEQDLYQGMTPFPPFFPPDQFSIKVQYWWSGRDGQGPRCVPTTTRIAITVNCVWRLGEQCIRLTRNAISRKCHMLFVTAPYQCKKICIYVSINKEHWSIRKHPPPLQSNFRLVGARCLSDLSVMQHVWDHEKWTNDRFNRSFWKWKCSIEITYSGTSD